MNDSETPLSDLIESYVEVGDQACYERFLVGFRNARVGAQASGGAPKGTPGDVVSTDEQPVSIAASTDADGNPVLLAFADPAAFSRNFGVQFNAEVTGEALLKTVLSQPDCYGVRVNSAKEEISILIDRSTAATLVEASAHTPVSGPRPWWKFW